MFPGFADDKRSLRWYCLDASVRSLPAGIVDAEILRRAQVFSEWIDEVPVAKEITREPIEPKRNETIFVRHKSGESKSHLAMVYGISPSRISSIIDRERERELRTSAASLTIDTDIEQFGLTVRTSNCLKGMGCHTLRDALKMQPREMLDWPNFGRKSLNELRDVLGRFGYRVAWEHGVERWKADTKLNCEEG